MLAAVILQEGRDVVSIVDDALAIVGRGRSHYDVAEAREVIFCAFGDEASVDVCLVESQSADMQRGAFHLRSQMEGAATTRKVAKEMLRKQAKPKDKSQQMILNNYNTIRYLSEHKNDNLTLGEIWYKLRINKGYKRHIGSLYRIMRKLGYYKQININSTSKYIPKEYNTPKMIGEKWQIDVKFVPTQCLGKDVPSDKKYYQYTCIDEATRERFLFWYDEHTPSNTVDFVKRCITYFEYKPVEIQTDNGTEFTWKCC